MAFEQVESVWPVHGSVLVRTAWSTAWPAGRCSSTAACGCCGSTRDAGGALGDRAGRPRPGDGRGPAGVRQLAEHARRACPTSSPATAGCVYMRSQPFELDGTRLPLEAMPRWNGRRPRRPAGHAAAEHAHLFCPTGFLDDTWWHRTYWMYGSRFVSGWCGYFLAGKAAPAGRILVFDDRRSTASAASRSTTAGPRPSSISCSPRTGRA